MFNDDSGTNLFVGDLASYCEEHHIESIFRDNGFDVVDVKLMRGTQSKLSLNYGFVRLRTKEDAFKAIATLNCKMFYGRTIKVSWAVPNLKSNKGSAQSHSIHIKFRPVRPDGTVTEELLRKVFSAYGTVADVFIKTSNSGRSLVNEKYGFIHFTPNDKGLDAAFRAVDALSEPRVLDGIEYACEPSQKLIQYVQQRQLTHKYQHLLPPSSLVSPSPSPNGMNYSPDNMSMRGYDPRSRMMEMDTYRNNSYRGDYPNPTPYPSYPSPAAPYSSYSDSYNPSYPPSSQLDSLRSISADGRYYNGHHQMSDYNRSHMISNFSRTESEPIRHHPDNNSYSKYDYSTNPFPRDLSTLSSMNNLSSSYYPSSSSMMSSSIRNFTSSTSNHDLGISKSNSDYTANTTATTTSSTSSNTYSNNAMSTTINNGHNTGHKYSSNDPNINNSTATSISVDINSYMSDMKNQAKYGTNIGNY